MTADGTALAPQDASAGALSRERAPAKLNLFLHVRGQRDDGYHLLESLVVFADIGDLLEADPAAGLSLAVQGPFGDLVGTGDDNLVIRAAQALRAGHPARGAALTLHKNLPVAAGIGGGSADAAAALRLLSRHWTCPIPEDAALRLGADVPVCLASRPALMSGIGETLAPAPAAPEFGVVLANPLVGVPTGAVFGALARRDNPPGPPAPARGFTTFGPFAEWLALQRNDLQAPAATICQPVSQVLAALTSLPGARIARMSGSGATCIAIFETLTGAETAADLLRRSEPGWWVAASAIPAVR